MPRRIDAILGLDGTPYLEEARRVEAETRAMDRDMDKLGRSIDAVEHDMTELAASTEVAKHQVDDLGDKARGTATDLQLLDARIEASKAKVRELGLEFARTGDEVGGKDLGRERSLLGKLERLRAELKDLEETPLPDVAEEIEKAVTNNKRGPSLDLSAFTGLGHGALIGGIIAAVVAALPAIGALIGGAVAGATGTAAMAAGILSATHDTRVQRAAHDFGDFVSGEFFAGGENFAEPVVKGLDILKHAVADLGLDDLLEPLAPTVEIIARGIADFVKNLDEAGLSETLQRMPEFATIAAAGFAELGTALGEFLDTVTEGPGALAGMRALFSGVTFVVEYLGAAIHVLAATFETLARASALASGVLEDAFAWIPWIAGPMAALNDSMEKLSGTSTAVAGQIDFMTSAAVMATRGLDPFNAYLKEAAQNADSLKFSLNELFGIQMNVDQATLHMKEQIFALNEELKKGRFVLDDTSEAGLRHQAMVQSAIQSAIALADATYAQTKDQHAAEVAYDEATAALRKLLEAAGLAKAEIERLVGSYSITITTTYHTVGRPPVAVSQFANEQVTDLFRAAGGPVREGDYVVGEKGPEILHMGPGEYGQVYSNPQSRAMTWNGGGGPAPAAWAGSVILNVYASPLSSPGEVGAAAVKAIKQYENLNGDGWRR